MHLTIPGKWNYRNGFRTYTVIECSVVAVSERGILLRHREESGWFPKQYVTVIDETHAKVPTTLAISKGFINGNHLPFTEKY